MADKPRILWCSQSPAIDTGYGIISREILTRLHATGKYEIACQAWFEKPKDNPSYQYEASSSSAFPFKLFHTDAGNNPSPEAKDGQKNIGQIIDQFKPDITIWFSDIYMVEWLLKDTILNKTNSILYFPIDGLPIPDKWADLLMKIDKPITFSQFGKKVVENTLKQPVEMIYHGINYPFWSSPVNPTDVAAFKTQIFGTDDVFVIGSVARNQPRKNLPALYEAFSEHAKTHPKSRLLIHACNIDQGWMLTRLAQEFSIEDKVYIPKNLSPNKGVSLETLRLIYNAMDIHVNVATGEGFGIPIAESMACGIPNLVTAYTVGPELVAAHKAGALINIGAFMVEPISHIRRAYIQRDHLIHLLNTFSEDKALRRQSGRNAKVAMSQFNWPPLIKQWEKTIDAMLQDNKNKIGKIKADII
jgi:glycosyltransferase involved in cell wall biosynthesis